MPMRTLILMTVAVIATSALGAAYALPPELPHIPLLPPGDGDDGGHGNNTTGGNNTGGNNTSGNGTGGNGTGGLPPGHNNTGGNQTGNNTGGNGGNNTGGNGGGNNNTGGGPGPNATEPAVIVHVTPLAQVVLARSEVRWDVTVCSAHNDTLRVDLSGRVANDSSWSVSVTPDEVRLDADGPCATVQAVAVHHGAPQAGVKTLVIEATPNRGQAGYGYATFTVVTLG